MKDGFVDTPHGRLHYLHAGAGDALVLLHSNGCSAHEYAGVMAGLAGTAAVYALDLVGHGDSDPLDRHYGIEMHGDAVLAFMDALDIERAVVAGSSVGGLIALQLSRDAPHRLTAAGLIETPIRTYDWWGEQWPRLEKAFTTTGQSFEEVKPRFRNLTPAFHDRWNIDRAKAGAKTMMDVMWAGREFDANGALDHLAAGKLPVLVAIGDRGPIADLVDEYRRRLPRATHALFEGCGHFPMIDEPARFVQVLGDFAAAARGR